MDNTTMHPLSKDIDVTQNIARKINVYIFPFFLKTTTTTVENIAFGAAADKNLAAGCFDVNLEK